MSTTIGAEDGDPSRRNELERRATRLLAGIEMRCAYMRRESRWAIEAYILSGRAVVPHRVRSTSLSSLRTVGEASSLQLGDLNRYVPYWQSLVPTKPDVRAALIRLLAEKYGLAKRASPAIRAALGANDHQVRRSYEEIYGGSLDEVYDLRPPLDAPAPATRNSQEAALRRAAAALEWIMLPGGETLYNAGDEGDSLYTVISGRLQVTVQLEEDPERPVAELGRGEIVGLTEALTAEQRADNVYALRDSEVVRLPVKHLQSLARQYPEVWRNLSSILATRLRSHLTAPPGASNTLQTFTIVTASPAPDTVDFVRRFVEALGQYGPTLCINSSFVDERLGAGAAQCSDDALGQIRLIAWLAQLEADNRYVVYVADSPRSEWFDRCVRQADRVLVVTDHEASIEGTAQLLRHVKEVDSKAQTELVLLQLMDCLQPAGTARLLASGEFTRHHHLRVGSAADLKRLVRRITGTALGLVLGGGGARGWAHIGVWRALHEAGLEVDLLGGTSMGALLAGVLAMGLDEEAVVEMARQFSAPAKLFDWTLPVVSFLSSGKATEVLRSVYGNIEIEDLWRPFFCVASNLTRAKQVVFTAGPLWQAVRASTAIPGIFAPMLHEGDVLVDGAILNNLPTDVMATFGGGSPMVAVNVFPDVDVMKDYQFDPSVSGWEVLLKQLNPLSHSLRVPWIFETLVRTMALNDVQQARTKRGLADLYIRPPVERFNILDFGAYDEIIQVGYETARQKIDEWLNTGGHPQDEEGRQADLPPAAAGTRDSKKQLKDALGALEKALRDTQE